MYSTYLTYVDLRKVFQCLKFLFFLFVNNINQVYISIYPYILLGKGVSFNFLMFTFTPRSI
ncbi:hypothetical protein C2G38_1035192 [Gigaspora rosea]|uniref:Uncharacterized protein n=1 Tax=Gigaspora rosea TaxID=44941 RepID=A0A397TWB3_9GLOM|nr:hypothetical protein C2G38_1035192 [Gigaspora rosea]